MRRAQSHRQPAEFKKTEENVDDQKKKTEKVDDLKESRRETEEGKGTGPARTFKKKQ